MRKQASKHASKQEPKQTESVTTTNLQTDAHDAPRKGITTSTSRTTDGDDSDDDDVQ